MIFHNRLTGRPALWITPYDPSWKDQDNPTLFRITGYEDLPCPVYFAHIFEQLDIHPVIWENQGKKGLYSFLRAFFMDDYVKFMDLPIKRNLKHLLSVKKRRKGRKMLKEARAAEKDFYFFLLPSGFPDGKLPEN